MEVSALIVHTIGRILFEMKATDQENIIRAILGSCVAFWAWASYIYGPRPEYG